MMNPACSLLESDPTVIWENAIPLLRHELGEAPFKSWLLPLNTGDLIAGTFHLFAPSRFMKDWVVVNYEHIILKILSQLNSQIIRIDISVKARPRQEATALHIIKENAKQETSTEDIFEAEDYTAALDLRYTFENFIVGKSNELAYAAAMRVSESDKPLYNPLFLHGGVGLGKTHLMHAIAWQIHRKHPQKKVIYLSAEKFMYTFVQAIRSKDPVAFKERLRNVDVLMIDDVQFIGGKDSTQEEFFHTFNALVDQNKQVIISADKSPSDLEKIGDRLKSRLAWGLVADIHPTTYELRLGILQSKVENMKMDVDVQILEFLASKITSNIRELEGALNRIIAHATLIGRTITIDSTREVLKDVLKSNDKRLTIEDIQRRVCEHYTIKLSDMLSAKRTQNITKPRQIAMYLSKVLTSKSLPEIGKKFGGKDHTSVLHSVRKIESAIQDDPELNDEVERFKRLLL